MFGVVGIQCVAGSGTAILNAWVNCGRCLYAISAIRSVTSSKMACLRFSGHPDVTKPNVKDNAGHKHR